MSDVLTVVWGALNTPVGVAIVAGIILWALNRLYAARPTWRQWEGTIIAAVKHAERIVPDDSPAKPLRRLDEALRYVLRVYEATTGRRADEAVQAELREGIQVKHAELEEAGTL